MIHLAIVAVILAALNVSLVASVCIAAISASKKAGK